MDLEKTRALSRTYSPEGLAKAGVSAWIFCILEIRLMIATRLLNILLRLDRE
jgi:hypothetical protein